MRRRAPGWPKGRTKPIAAFQALFPSQLLAEDLKRIGVSPSRAAILSGLTPTTVLDLVHGGRAAFPRTLVRILDALNLDRGPYSGYLEAASARLAPVTLVCPECGRKRLLKRGTLAQAAARVPGRQTLPRLADGSYQRRCKTCSRKVTGRALAKRATNRVLNAPFKGTSLSVLDTFILKSPDEKTAKKLALRAHLHGLGDTSSIERQKKFRELVRQPRTERHRQGIAFSKVAGARLRRPFHLCPLCELAIYAQEWHRICWYTWLRWYRRHVGPIPGKDIRPLPTRARGPKPESNLRRNYSWLIARRVGSHRIRELLDNGLSAKGTVTMGVRAFLRRLPASWNLVFSSSKLERRANAQRQKIVSLPLEVESWIAAGERDGLIRRLVGFGMAEGDVASLTGASVYRVRGIGTAALTGGEEVDSSA